MKLTNTNLIRCGFYGSGAQKAFLDDAVSKTVSYSRLNCSDKRKKQAVKRFHFITSYSAH